MKPDSFIPFYGNDFLQAVEGHPDSVAMGYFRAIWHYWHHTHCRGLRDEQEFLRKLCRIEREDWERAMAVIFDNDKFFTLGEEGLWHQKAAAVIWAESVVRYEKVVNAGRAGGLKAARNRRAKK